MDSTTVFTKSAKGLMEATGKTSALSRDLRALLKEIDGKATVAEVQSRFGRLSEAKLQEALDTLTKDDFIREFVPTASSVAPSAKGSAAPPRKRSGATEGRDLDFTAAIPTARQGEGGARQKAQAAADAAARARAEADATARAAAAAAARAKAEAEARARAEAAARAKRDAEERARREAEEKARREAEARAQAQQQARIEAEARARKEAEEKARREADELRAKLEEERKAHEEAERRAKEQAERKRKDAEDKARREAEELRAKLDEERKAREESERQAKAQAERERKEAEDKARREADELRAKLEEERKAREDAERRAAEQAEDRKAREESERRAKQDAERKAREDAERKAREDAERVAREAQDREAREAEERSRKLAEDKARAEAEAARDAEEHARRTAAEQAPAKAAPAPGPSLDDLVKIEIDFDAVPAASAETNAQATQKKAGAEEQMLRDLEEKARKDAEERARIAAEEKARADAEAREKREQEDKDRGQDVKGPAARELDYAEAQALLEAENKETERHFAEMEKELEAEAAAAKDGKIAPETREDARQRAKDAASARFSAEAAAHVVQARPAAEEPRMVVYRTPIKWGKPVVLALFLILVLGAVWIQFTSFASRIPQFERLASTHLQQPVKIKALHLSLVPWPHWQLDGVSVGNEGQLEVARINAAAELGSMFSDDKAFKSIELESPVLSEQGLIALLFGKPQGQGLKVASIIVKNGKLNSKSIALPALDARIAMGEDGGWKKIALETPDHKTSLQLEPKGEEAQLEVETNAFSMPFGPAFILENFNATGVVSRSELRLNEFKGAMYGGYLSGTATLKWGADWSLGGQIGARAMEPGKIAPSLLEDGKLEGKATYAMRAKSYDELFAAPRVEGNFAIQKGSLLGVDLARLLQGSGAGGKTAFSEMTGNFVRENGRTQLRQVRLVAGPVSAGGTADVDSTRNISGRFAVELKSPVAQARANLSISGTLREPHFSR